MEDDLEITGKVFNFCNLTSDLCNPYVSSS